MASVIILCNHGVYVIEGRPGGNDRTGLKTAQPHALLSQTTYAADFLAELHRLRLATFPDSNGVPASDEQAATYSANNRNTFIRTVISS